MSAILEISTQVGCAVGCGYCPQSTHVHAYAKRSDQFKMSLLTFQRCLDALPNTVEIHFAGMAEPFLNEHAVGMVLDADLFSYDTKVYSTLVGLKLTDVPKLAQCKIKEFCIHVPDDAGQMRVTVDDEYLKVFDACVRELPQRHFTCIGKPHPRLLPLLPQLNDDTPGLISRASNLKTIPRKTGPIRCSAVEGEKLEHNILLPNGDVCLCCCDYGLKAIIGNLLNDKYDDLFKSPEYLRIKRGQADESEEIICRGCEYAEAVHVAH